MTNGRLSIQTPALAASDAAAARTQGSYSKLVLNLNRFQGLTDTLRLVLNYTGQRAFKNLDSSEKFSIGGLSGVRAYPPGEAAGDDVDLLQAELKYQWGALLDGEFVPFLFVDAGRSTINHEAFAGFAGSNVRHLSGYGVGAEWSRPPGLVIRAWWAFKHGQEAATAGADRSSRLWFQAGVLF
jgi:hemolysin activation/secretion protein